MIVSHSESLLKRICTRRIDLKALQEKDASSLAGSHIDRENRDLTRRNEGRNGCSEAVGRE